tara:strand:- start:563 stop:1411 length:849 start_codon:yes stop_codon:yes gene_type:complete
MFSKLAKGIWRKLFPILQKTIPILYGNGFISNLNKAAIVFHLLYENNNYDPKQNGEEWLLSQLSKFSPKIIFDVGANKGIYSQIVLKRCPDSFIYAFEPIPFVFSLLKDSLGESSKVKIFQSALSNKEGEIILFYDKENDGNTSAVRGVQDSIHGLKSYEEVSAKTMRLDQFCTSNKINYIDLLKIDVEGFESIVLEGAHSLIVSKKIKVIQVEYGKANLFSRYFIHDYFNDYSEHYVIGKLFPKGVIWFESYSTELDDLLGPNLIMVLKNEINLIKNLSLN